jgi:S-(hydroxymethyl)glutathione dehydrogenase / alcohol dehydrogenase
MLAEALALVSKGGRVVCTAMAPSSQNQADINLFGPTMSNKSVLGSLFGSFSPRAAIPTLLAMCKACWLDVDSLYTCDYALSDVNAGYADLRNGRNIGGVIAFD